ncbi:hypothetical protein [Nocardia stercoris]|uniref:Uncharacterized protein n=1 Tax=Nocardia stercoris TaxID=2483361 RepID=A0A3M2LDW4_9NOCA|nr:hypothetical protein [Nocardia stercoris]RMI35226.1 hypothetical protein EBN03_02750 [Nocardia stercoris]
MGYPVQFGLAQALLVVVGLIAAALLVSAVVDLRPIAALEGEAAGGLRRLRRWRVRPRIRLGRGASGVLVLILAVVLFGITALIQTYLGLTGEVKAAHIVASPLSNAPHMMSVELTLYDGDGKTASRRTYQVEGDMWVLQADIVELSHWVNVLGVHSGYKVTRLFGEREDGSPVTSPQIFVNGGDGDFFHDMHDGSWWTKPFVRSAYGNAVIATPGEYDVYISQDAIKTRPAGR